MAVILGTSGDDVLVDLDGVSDLIWGDTIDALLSGVGGNDRIFGRALNDDISGDATTIGPNARGGDDYISGGDGDDLISGDARDTLYGRGGNDTLYQDAGSNRMFGDAPTLAAGAKGGNDRLFGGGDLVGDGNNLSSATGGHDRLDASSAVASATLAGDARLLMVGASKGGRDTLIGSDFSDRLSGDSTFNMTDTSIAGGDWLNGRGGDDEILGDAEQMYSFTRGGNDVLRGGAGADKLYGDAEQLRNWAIGGNDKIYAGTGNDEIWGDGQLFDDAVGGQDQFYFSDAFGDDRILDFRLGEDTIHLSGVSSTEVQITATGGNTTLTTFSDHSITLVGFTGVLTYGTDVIFS